MDASTVQSKFKIKICNETKLFNLTLNNKENFGLFLDKFFKDDQENFFEKNVFFYLFFVNWAEMMTENIQIKNNVLEK